MPTDQEKLNQNESAGAASDKEREGARGRKIKPLFIILIIAGVVILAITGLVVALIMKRGRNEKPPEAPAYYFSEDEQVSSVTTVLGERQFEILEIESETALESASASSETADQGNTDTSAATKQDSSTASETETENEFTPRKYKYYPEEAVQGDLDTYIEYLKSEKGFIDVTAESETGETQESEAETETDTNPAILLTGPSVHPENYLTILLESAADSYTVTAAAVNEPWNTYFTNLWEEQKKELKQAQNKKPEQKTTKEKAEESVTALGMEKLGLSGSLSEYQFIANSGLVTVDQENYYSVTAYRQQENGTVIFAAAYLLDYETGKKIYRFDIISNEITPLN